MKTLKLFTFFIFLVCLSTNVFCHKQEIHQHVTREAFQLLKMAFPPDFTGLDEMENRLGFSESENSGLSFKSIGDFKIVAGAWMEDEWDVVYHYGTPDLPNYEGLTQIQQDIIWPFLGIVNSDFRREAHATITHFWDADNGEEATTHLGDILTFNDEFFYWSFTISENAMQKLRKYYTGNYVERRIHNYALNLDNTMTFASDWVLPGIFDIYNGLGEEVLVGAYNSNGQYDDDLEYSSVISDWYDWWREGYVYNRLGRMCHLLQDMSVPAHVHCISHAGPGYDMHVDLLESNELDYHENYHTWTAQDVLTEHGGFIDPYIHEDPLYYLMYFLNQIADYFTDGVADGDVDYDSDIPRLGEIISTLEGPVSASELNEETCRIIYDYMIPYAIKATAGLLYWFAVESGQIEQLPEPALIYGNVGKYDESDPTDISIDFRCLSNSNHFLVHPDEQGNFSYIFDYMQAGLYDIYITHSGYYPVVIRNFEIIEDQEIGSFILHPIESLEHIIVSQDVNVPAFRDISTAVEYLQESGSGTIYMEPGEYTGEHNRNIRWYPLNFSNFSEPLHIRIRAFEPHSVILDCQGQGVAFIFDNEGMDNGYTEDDIIEGLIIRNAEQGIVIRNGSPVIRNNIIENCHTYAFSEYTNGVGISTQGTPLIENNTITNNIGSWSGNSLSYNTYGGGIYIENNNAGEVTVINNEITGCSAQEGGAIYCTGSGPIVIQNNYLQGNTLIEGNGINNFPGDCVGICAVGCDHLQIVSNLIVGNVRPEYNGSNVVGIFGCDNVFFLSNTVADNPLLKGIKLTNNEQCLINNCIITGNEYGIYTWSGNIPLVTYSNVWNNFLEDYSGSAVAGIGCISIDPEFSEPLNGNYELTWDSELLSPCIDSGDPDLRDPDDSPSDMGALIAEFHDFHITDLTKSPYGMRYRWVCFPVLDRLYVAAGSEVTYIFDPVIADLDFIRIYYDITSSINYNYGFWGNPDFIIESHKGYKVTCSENVYLPTTGQKLQDSFVMNLETDEENWIGYFIKEPMSVMDAFASIWDKIISVASEDWFFAKDNVYPPERCVLIYGKMYSVRVSEDCQFVWGQGGDPVIIRERVMTDAFQYNESPDYTPIVITDLGDQTITEVGILLDGSCIGASQVDELPLQILAFLPENTRGNGEVTFQFFTENRSYLQPEMPLVFNPITSSYENQGIQLEPYQPVTVSFGDNEIPVFNFQLEQNRPNPFNPETRISFTLPEESPVIMEIFNVKGQLIRELTAGILGIGNHTMIWDGKDEQLKSVSSGIYFYRLTAGENSSMKKMLLIK
ncbi:MAG: right-handed parallel beta-helix repeat-containing protein [Candidatus Cloacimonetes bacterium]|nr:right-handed parallel beta-helix repeat-containing protein [Candidatus Cloacimonadota bacterium]